MCAAKQKSVRWMVYSTLEQTIIIVLSILEVLALFILFHFIIQAPSLVYKYYLVTNK